ncbi:hypothetical protein [Nocardia gipuzkoensis]
MMGFRDVADLFEDGRRLRSELAAGGRLSVKDWRRTLMATEFVPSPINPIAAGHDPYRYPKTW